jgi:hypothetical protein
MRYTVGRVSGDNGTSTGRASEALVGGATGRRTAPVPHIPTH